MSIIDKALEANRIYAKTYKPTGKGPAPKIVVVTCMDPRLLDFQRRARPRLHFRRGHRKRTRDQNTLRRARRLTCDHFPLFNGRTILASFQKESK
jgi:hypothetical protein